MEVNTRSEVNRIPECGWTKHSRCSEVEIEDIGTSHMTVSQQPEQVWVVTGEEGDAEGRLKPKIVSLQMKLKPNRITCRISDFDYNPESRLLCYGATMTIDIIISCRRSNEFSKRGR